jgi:hypothetical protein
MMIRSSALWPTSLVVLCCFALLGTLTVQPKALSAGPSGDAPDEMHVINQTNLRNTVTNFGSFGSLVKPYPSCEWPSASTNMYLHDGELWVGGVVAGDTVVTTGRFSGREWFPVEGIGIMSEASAFSDQDTYTRYTDLEDPLEQSGEHLPLGILVSQRNLAWAGEDFIVHDMIIENVGPADLTDVYIGLCWDFNIARLAGGNFGADDLVGFDKAEEISYMFDDDGDGGLSPGFIGGSFLNSPQAGHGWWTSSQEPLDDAARYALLSGALMDDPSEPDDYRLIQSVGAFDFPVGRKIPLIYALAIGEGPTNLQETVLDAAEAVVRDTVAIGDSTLYDGDTHAIPVTLGEIKLALGRVQFAVDWEFCDLGLILIDPQGNQITPESALASPFISFMAKPHRKAYEIVNPLLGEWTLLINYNTGPGLIDYRHTSTVFGLPWDFGLPMDHFMITRAYIRFETAKMAATSAPTVFRVWGEMTLKPGASFDHTLDPVTLQMGPYQETLPPGSFVPQGNPSKQIYNYTNSEPGHEGIAHMILNFNKGEFRAYASRVNMSGTENPVLVRLAIGPDTGFENILMEESGNQWYYTANGKTLPKTLASVSSVPKAFSLSQNYPNPFNATTQISYDIPQEAQILLAIYNVRGQQVAVLVDGQQPAGTYCTTWDGRDALGNEAASGIYLCHLRAADMSTTRKMILLR